MDIQLIPEAQKEYISLDGSLRKLVDDKFGALEKNPYLGELLGNKNNIDLTGYYKIYFNQQPRRKRRGIKPFGTNKKKHRIVNR